MAGPWIKSFFSYLLVFLLTTSAVVTAAPKPPTIHANAAILMDAKTGEVLFAQNIHKRYAPASTTKVLTAIIAIESGRLEEEVEISLRAAGTGGSSMHLYAGQKLSLRELVTGLLLRSGNDAAVAIAEHLSGSVEEFVLAMNAKAQSLGAVNSNFRNPHGLTAVSHYSTAFDLAWISRYALTNPIFAEIVNTRETTIDWLDRRGKEKDANLRNTNKLLWMLEDADGVKTGTTGEAGPCLVSSATRGNQRLIAVVLHDHSRWQDSMQLLKYGFDSFDIYEYADAGDIVGPITVEGGTADAVDVTINQVAAVIVKPEDYPHVTVELDLPEKIKAPVYQGQKIGEVIFFVRDKAVKTVDIISTKDVAEQTPTSIFFEHLLYLFRIVSGWGVF
ncbi:D-alanyl-D-alanine carboxypeptidase family protein [Anaerospora hongkongensis]|uniref:D-alanyl-D-alanine carboxypeptidase family protein n=1 Tax=Anaerospora hongkongensis TaxID=244830 RepID=UPI0028A22737|nr:D-alanyl-D-alanine carboxypeptidase family protein [Anaerospora hongkongensis]